MQEVKKSAARISSNFAQIQTLSAFLDMSAFRFFVFVVFCFVVQAQTQTYSYTKIAETADPSQHFGIVTIGTLPLLSDTGSVAYTLSTDAPYPNGLTPIPHPAAYVNENGLVRRLGDPSLASVVLDINSSGSVLFLQSDNDGRAYLYLDSAGNLDLIASSDTGGFASFSIGIDGGAAVNDNGDVAFIGLKDTGTLGAYVRITDGSLTTVSEVGSGLPPISSLSGLRINNNRIVTFAINYDMYFGVAGSPLTNLSMSTPSLNTPPSNLGNPWLNNNDTIAFCINGLSTNFPAGAILQAAGGASPQRAINGVGPLPAQVFSPVISDSGAIAYFAGSPTLTTLVYSINVVLKSGANASTVIRSGDTLFGGTVSQLGNLIKTSVSRYFNSSGQIAFSYSLTDGRKGIALATPNR